ncbi:D-ribose pyranase [Actimicrobium sp. CCC2.4]|uniref:D-ribose pyranase n=1 Tax=Actimicrobium sp. CCC2.4 TaxID=3048606 RepID=UPI002AC8A30A|nr:D-ribose pyranase [Actimicrobium sp. CCC2.4]MEB0136563.1 D-ribose pyranase [Actimicrobium sp. CCC2.4]WPX31751.1 D-ribose pyranase [Actimicrobium sp. CCC2.4]
MKKTLLLNIALSQLIASLGHGDAIVISDVGFPVPPGVPLIDLALTRGIPGLLDTLQAILTEMQVEQHVLASELALHSPDMASAIAALELPGRLTMSHADFKQHTRSARAIVRTGECTPFANIVLVAGVAF